MFGRLNNEVVKRVRGDGVAELLAKLFQRFVYRRQTFVMLSYDLNTRQKHYKLSTRWTIGEFTAADLDKLDSYLKKYKEDYRELFAIGCRAFGAFEKESDQLIGIICFADKDFYDKHYQKHAYAVAPHQVYQFAGEVAQPYRMTAVAILVLMAGWQYWREALKTEAICSINEKNVSSLRLHFHLGFKEMGVMIHCHRLLGVRWSSRSPYIGERLSQHKRKASAKDLSQSSG